MKVSRLKLAFYVSLLVHGMAFSVIYAVQWVSLSQPIVAAFGDRPILEITVEPQDIETTGVVAASIGSDVSSVPVPASQPGNLSAPDSIPFADVSDDWESPFVSESEYPSSEAAAKSALKNRINTDSAKAAAGEKLESTGSQNLIRTDIGVAYLLNPKPGYPREARQRKEQGLVLLEVLVNAAGYPEEVCMKQSAGYRTLDAAALQAVKRWRFVPARRGNENVASRIEIPIRFQLSAS